MFMWRRRFLCPGTTEPCSSKYGEDMLVDGSAQKAGTQVYQKTGMPILLASHRVKKILSWIIRRQDKEMCGLPVNRTIWRRSESGFGGRSNGLLC
jgi:hypothetical protein